MRLECAVTILISLAFGQLALAERDRADLVISGNNALDFGEKFVGHTFDQKIKIKNVGTLKAKYLQVYNADFKDPFDFKDGSFPGTKGTCDKALNVGETCTVWLSYHPKKEGLQSQNLQIAYHDGYKYRLIEKEIRGTGITEGCSAIKRTKQKLTFEFDSQAAPSKDEKLGDGHYWCLLKQNGRVRSFYMHIPSSNFPPAVVMAFHGATSDHFKFDLQTSMVAASQAEKFIAVLPQWNPTESKVSTGVKFNDQVWRNPAGSELDDVEFAREILKMVQKQVNTDPARVYAAGQDLGGAMAFRVGCEMSDSVAAVLTVGAGMLSPCVPTHPVSVMQIHGKRDPVWPFFGGPSCFVAADMPNPTLAAQTWEKINQCPAGFPPRLSLRQIGMECYTRGPCAAQTETTFCTVAKGGATWPGGRTPKEFEKMPWTHECPLARSKRAQKYAFGVGQTLRFVSATQVMWKFFRRHVRPEKVLPRANASTETLEKNEKKKGKLSPRERRLLKQKQAQEQSALNSK